MSEQRPGPWRPVRRAVRRLRTRLLGEVSRLRASWRWAVPRWTYRLSPEGRRSARALEALRNSATGRRCVIIGNGPSLNRMDLSALAGEVTFGLNRGYLLFPRLGGPTTYLVSVNQYVLKQSRDEMLAARCLKFFNWRNRPRIPARRDDVIYVRTEPQRRFSTDVVRDGVWEGATVTFVAMQLAFHLGYREVVLIGVDHRFTTPGPPHQLVQSAARDANHFDPSYFGAGYRWQLPDLELSEQAFRLAREAFEAAGGSIVDATVGGELTVFPKADFGELFPGDGAARADRSPVPLRPRTTRS